MRRGERFAMTPLCSREVLLISYIEFTRNKRNNLQSVDLSATIIGRATAKLGRLLFLPTAREIVAARLNPFYRLFHECYLKSDRTMYIQVFPPLFPFQDYGIRLY